MTHAEISAFIAVAQLGSFLQAAQMLAITQSTVSQRVASLERSMKGVLFERSTRAVRLSAAGERFLPHATKLLDAYADAEASTRVEQASSLSGHILPTMDPVPIQAAMSTLMRTQPQLLLRIQTSTGQEAVRNLQSRLLDFAILPPPDVTGVRLRTATLLVFKEEVRAYVAPGHALLKRRRLTLQQLGASRVPVVHLSLWWKRPRQLALLLKAAAVACEMPIEVGLSWCVAGGGVMFLNAGYARRFVAAGQLAPLGFVDLPTTYRIVHLVKPRSAPLAPALAEFCAVVADTARTDGVEVTQR